MRHNFSRLSVPAPRTAMHLLVLLSPLASALGCMSSQSAPAAAPVPRPSYDFTPTTCQQPGSTKITLAIVAPRWQSPIQPAWTRGYSAASAPQLFADLSNAMQGDFMELATCLGYLARGPFDSFEAMVFPDREASQLLLEPELQMDVEVTALSVVEQSGLGGIIKKTGTYNRLNGTASLGGRVTLSLKEPVTNTRMWTRSIDIPSEAFSFTSDNKYATAAMTPEQARIALLDDPALLRPLYPKLQALYGSVFTTAQSYMNAREVATVASQGLAVRKRGAVAIPPL